MIIAISSPNLFIASVVLGLGLGAAIANGQPAPSPASGSSGQKDLSLIWHDEFDGPRGADPDPRYWTYDLGAGGWGNHELEEYTNRRENAALNGQGQLVITARRDAEGRYTSARLKTLGKVVFLYGRVEARIRIPRGRGIWPAFWMMGANIDQVHWPACGEVDIMENVGKEPRTIHGSVHGPGYSGGEDMTGKTDLAGSGILADDFHIYGVNWSPQRLEFTLDGAVYKTATPSDLPPNAKWVFNADMFLLINLAVGGDWPGNPDASSQFPQQMLVDYVRVYAPGTAKRLP